MKVLITGGAGFLGRRLARALLARGATTGPEGRAEAIDRLVLLDVVPAEGIADARVEVVTGDLGDETVLRRALAGDTGSVFHLAAVVSAEAEAHFDLGMRVNVDGTRRLLDACRPLSHPPRLVSTSSVAVYGGAVAGTVTDTTALTPLSSYGAQKAIAELLVAEYGRKGFVDGRIVRLPTVSVRPGKPNQAASSFASGIIREPLAGVEAVCPVAPTTRIWLVSPRRAVDALIHAHELPESALQGRPSINLPGVSVTVAEMVAALAQVAGGDAAARIRWEHDPLVDRIVSSWPGSWDCTRALGLGFGADPDFASIIRAYVEDDLPSVRGAR